MKKVLFALGLIFIFVFTSKVSAADNFGIAQCRNECSVARSTGLLFCSNDYLSCKSACGSSECRRECLREFNLCRKNFTSEFKICSKLCLGADLRCLNETFERGEEFLQGCDVCKCNSQGKVTCSREAFCNKNYTISQADCAGSDGLFAPICNGPYFDIVCSQKKYCICAGNNGYSCPSGYECLMDFISPNKRTHTIDGWKTLLGEPLGDIGVCVR